MSPKDAKGHGRGDKDPKDAKTAKIVRNAPFPPTAPASAKETAAKAGALRRALLAKRKGGR